MMGPWLIFASFIHKACIALYPDAPKSREFGEFVTRAGVTMLGVVPTLVSTWRQSRCMEGLDWASIKTFSSTGECSNPEDMFYLMWLGGDKPIIEYCGGTEIGGAYLSSTLLQPNYPSLFSTPAMGNRIAALNEAGQLETQGELCLFPPAMGLSVQLENADHHHVYYEGMPVIEGRQLRRHGDELKQYPNGYYSIQGRVDDTMNLGGIKVGAAEIERAITGIPGIAETAAIAVSLNGQGRSELVIYATTTADLNVADTQKSMQQKINAHLNPLFKIYELIFVRELPKTATNKIIRRALRANYRKVEV
jgi:acetyl-CoA synthetase